MRLKGRRTIALLLAAVILAIGSVAGVAGMAAAGAEHRCNEECRMDASYWRDDCYWWETLPITPYEQQQVREIMVLILDRYFRIDISRMSSEEFNQLGAAIGREAREKALGLFEHYAEKKSFEVPSVLRDPRLFEYYAEKKAAMRVVPERPDISAVPSGVWKRITVRQWLEEGIAPQVRERQIAVIKSEIQVVKEVTPQLWENILNMTLWEFNRFREGLPPPPRRVASIQELSGNPYALAAFGKVPRLSTDAEIDDFADQLHTLRRALRGSFPWPQARVTAVAVSNSSHPPALPFGDGALLVMVDCYDVPVDDIYRVISEKADALLGIQDVPVIFMVARLRPATPSARQSNLQERDTTPAWSDLPGYKERWRPLVGGIAMMWECGSWPTLGFGVRAKTWWSYTKDFVGTGHIGWARVPVQHAAYQPEVAQTNRIGTVAYRTPWGSFADVSRIAVPDPWVEPYIHVGWGFSMRVVGRRDATVNELVFKSGAATGQTSGRVHFVEVDVWGGKLLDQTLAHLPFGMGDSGSPVFQGVGEDWVRIVAILAGGVHGLTVISPVTAIEAELGWTVYH